MNVQNSNPLLDPLLLPFLHAGDEREAHHQLEQLVARAAPIIKKITRSGRAPEDAFQETAQQVIQRLWDLKAHPDAGAIGNYIYYVKGIASHVVKRQVRDEHPRFRVLADALRHLLKREPSMAMWESESRVRFCGLASWRDQRTGVTRSERLRQLLDDPRSFDEVVPGGEAAIACNAGLLAQIFNWVGHPVRFDELVRIVCSLKRIEDITPVVNGEADGSMLTERLPDAGWRPDEEAEWREFLERLWAQIEQLPHLQRLAYLLNFTAADGQLELFWAYGVATIRRIGAALDLTEQQFALAWLELNLNADERCSIRALDGYDEKIALLWQHLPLADSVIARMLGTERQKVINLRKAAGDRLSRRLGRRSAGLCSC